MKNLILFPIMLVFGIVVLCVTAPLAFLFQLLYLPITVQNNIRQYDLQQERKKLFPEKYKDKK
jgi:hypothetical protein